MALNILMGKAGEAYAEKQFMDMGYKVTYPTEYKQGDLRVVDVTTGEIVRVEVKTARRGQNGRWQVCFRKGKKTDCHHADLVVMQLVLDSGQVIPYFIPSSDIGMLQGTSFSNATSPSGKWAGYRRGDYRIFGGVQ
ncbi:MAG: hypothetical protein MUE54_10810 [Anaerolineae bacterium]|jgi:hypothetical protein|nr:hypothetical protein [Anaerolineae bacterium]